MARKEDFVFEGFRYPTYTQVPDELFDTLIPNLTEAELKCLLYIIRRTFGFKKDSDSISARQFVEGIVTKDGRQLDQGTGLSNKGVWSGLKGLEEKGIVEVERSQAPDGDYEINVYRLRFQEEGVTTSGRYPYYHRKRGVTTSGSIQDTVKQDTEIPTEQSQNLSKFERPPDAEHRIYENNTTTTTAAPKEPEEPFESENIARIITEFSSQVLHDNGHVRSNITQVHNIWHESGLPEEEFTQALYEAKRIVLRWSGSIRKLANEQEGIKNRAPYFFRVLRNMVLPGES